MNYEGDCTECHCAFSPVDNNQCVCDCHVKIIEEGILTGDDVCDVVAIHGQAVQEKTGEVGNLDA